ncbi:hypothetical protein [Haloarchaeobius sp. DT45]|uniref:hypothetical protein n=1 Tax=Haloarchaeobius sp. DT45 TaxID=3446116 RepID=UPI003F6D11EA
MTELYGVAQTCLGIHREFSDDSDLEDEFGENITEKVSDAEEEGLEDLVEAYKNHAQALDQRFRVREMLISMFSKGVFTTQSDWKLLDTLSFRDTPGGPADLFVWQQANGDTISILTLTEVNNSGTVYSNLQQICSHVIENADVVGQEMADKQGSQGSGQPLQITKDRVEGAIVVSNINPTKMASKFVQNAGDSQVSVWEFDGADDEEISVISNVTTAGWDWHIPNNRLGKLLEDGQKFANQYQVSIDRFYDSHHELLFRELPAHLHRTRNRSKSRWYCSEDELVDFLSTSWSSPPREAVRTRAQDLIEWWEHIGVFIEIPDADEHYDEDESVYNFADFNGRKTDPTDFWADAVQPYREKVGSAIYLAYEESSHFDHETPLTPLVENAHATVYEG